jgi:hypothetical protein
MSLVNNNYSLDQDVDQYEITWSIDRTPDMNIFNNINNDYYMMAEFVTNNENNMAFTASVDAMTASINFDDYIPFNSSYIEINVDQVVICDNDFSCSICLESKDNPQICQLNCNHHFCENCIVFYVKNKTQSKCPLCREIITKIIVQTDEIRDKFI